MDEIQGQLRAGIRFFFFFLVLVGYFAIGGFYLLTVRDHVKRRRKFTHLGCMTGRFCLKFFNIKVNVKNSPPDNEVCLMVGNHLGFIDILSITAVGPVCFVTSKEMRDTPGLGLITELGGCLYVDRKSRTNIVNEMKAMAFEMKKGFRVLLYPEATSTNGEQVLPFKKTLMMAAAYAECPIHPYVFNFRKVNDGPVEFKYRDNLCWYGDQTFLPALWRALKLKSVETEIEFLEPLFITPEDDRSVVADKAFREISSRFVPFVPPIETGTELVSTSN